MQTHAQRHTRVHTCTWRHTGTQYTHAYIHIGIHTHMHRGTWVDTGTEAHRSACRYTQTCTEIQVHTEAHAQAHVVQRRTLARATADPESRKHGRQNLRPVVGRPSVPGLHSPTLALSTEHRAAHSNLVLLLSWKSESFSVSLLILPAFPHWPLGVGPHRCGCGICVISP